MLNYTRITSTERLIVLPIERDSMSDWFTRYEALVVLILCSEKNMDLYYQATVSV